MNKIFLLTLITALFIYSGSIHGQVRLIDPITKSNNPLDSYKISSDFGPRNYKNSSGEQISIFHYGIDYPRKNDKKAYAVESGQIADFSQWNHSYAYIRIIGNYIWRYMHVETSQYALPNQTTPIWEYHPDFFGNSANGDDFIFLREYDEDNDIFSTVDVLGTSHYDGGGGIYIYDSKTDDWAILKTTVTQKQWMFVARDYPPLSSGDGDHLHLGDNYHINRNVFKTVVYKDEHKPFIEYSKLKFLINNIATEFDGSIVFGNPIILESLIDTRRIKNDNQDFNDQDMDYYQVISTSMDNDNVYFSDYLKYTDGIGGVNYNVDLTHNVNILETTNHKTYEEAPNKGVYPFYGKVSLDYFKLHWPSKKSKVAGQAEAWVNDRAEYPDGAYEVKFMATDITGNTSTETKQVVLDNHIPYVSEVSLYSGKKIFGAKVSYEDPEGGAYDEGKLKYTVDEQQLNDCADFENDLEIYITTSEAMNDVSVEIPDAGSSGYTLNLSSYYGDPSVWKGVISKNELSSLFTYSANYQMVISGTDKAGNKIMNLNMSEENNEIRVIMLPHRDNDGNWDTFSFNERGYKIPFCSTDFIKAIFHAVIPNNKKNTISGNNSLYGYSPLEVMFTDASTGNPVEWNWDFGDNSLPVTGEQNPTHTFVNNTDEPVRYTVSLKACNETGCDIAVENKLITVYPEGYDDIPIADFSFSQETFSSPFVVNFFNYSAGNINSFEWNFGDGITNSSEFEPDHEYHSPGTYTVSLTLNPGTNEQIVYESDIEVLKASSDFVPIDFKWTCIANTDNMNSGEGIVGELVDFESTVDSWDNYFEWDMGDGYKVYNLSHPSHAFLNTGIYPITLRITNFAGELIGQKTKWLNVVANTMIIPPQLNEITFDQDITDVELIGDVMIIASGKTFTSYVFDTENKEWVLVMTHTMDHSITNLAGSDEFLFVSCAYEDYDGSSYKGLVHIFKFTQQGYFSEFSQNTIHDPEYYWYWRFGQFMDMDNNQAIISSYNEQGKHYKITFWQFNQNTQTWINTDVKFTQSHPTPPKISIKNNMVIINSILYENNNNSWIKADESIVYDDGYLGNGQEKNSISVNYLVSSKSDIDNSFAYIYKINGDGISSLPPVSLNNPENNFAYSVGLYENYLITGNDGYYINCDNYLYKTTGSSILYRANSSDYFYRYRIYTPQNLVTGESFGSKVYINKNHIIISSPGIDNNEYYKAPSIYHYDDYAYFGDRNLSFPNFNMYKLREDNTNRFAARIIDVAGGNNKATLLRGEHVEMIGQTITLKPGFSVIKGGSFRGVGTICENHNTAKAKYGKQDSHIETNQIVWTEPIFNKHKQSNFILMPNPTINQFSIISNNPHAIITQVLLFDTYGKLLKRIDNIQKQKSINLKIGRLSTGFYYVRISSKNTFEIKKVLKL